MKRFLCRCNIVSKEACCSRNSYEEALEWYINIYLYGLPVDWVDIYERVYSEDASSC